MKVCCCVLFLLGDGDFQHLKGKGFGKKLRAKQFSLDFFQVNGSVKVRKLVGKRSMCS